MEAKDIEEILKERLLDGINMCQIRLIQLEAIRRLKYPCMLNFKGVFIENADNPDIFLMMFPDKEEFWSEDLFTSIEKLIRSQMGFYQKCYDEGLPPDILAAYVNEFNSIGPVC